MNKAVYKKDGRGRRAGSKNNATIEREKDEAQLSEDERRLALSRERREKRSLQGSDGIRERLWAPQRPGWYSYWANDEGSRVQDLIDKGFHVVDSKSDEYKLVNSDQSGGSIAQQVGTDDKGKPIKGVLMEQPMEFREEDLALQKKENDAKMSQVKTGEIAGGAEEEHTYFKNIKIG